MQPSYTNLALSPTLPPRKPWVATLASLLLPGFGQFYNGELNKAIWIFLTFALLCIPGTALVALYLPSGWMLPALLVGLASALAVWAYAMVDAWRVAQRSESGQAKAWQLSGVYALVFVLCDLLALPLLTLYVRQHQVEPFHIPSASMEPSVLRGDKIWADKRYNCPGCQQGVHRGDIAVFAYPNDRSVRYIKRVIGLPGDRVQISGQQLLLNGKALSPDTAPSADGQRTEGVDGRQWQVQWTAPAPESTAPQLPPMNRVPTVAPAQLALTVPDGQVFVLGDNRGASVDSRQFGTVPLQDILGRARQVWLSTAEGGVRWERLGLVLR